MIYFSLFLFKLYINLESLYDLKVSLNKCRYEKRNAESIIYKLCVVVYGAYLIEVHFNLNVFSMLCVVSLRCNMFHVDV